MTFFKTSKVAGNISRFVFAIGLLATAQFGFAQDTTVFVTETDVVAAPMSD